jgi:predicted  nucleic acid-binding Zn-ribbon protein
MTVSADADEIAGTGGPLVTRRLLDLQELDVAIDRLIAKLDQLEAGKELGLARDRLGEAEWRQAELRLALDSVMGESRRLENDIDSIQRKIDAERKRLYDGSVVNAKELQSIEAEVESLLGRKSRMEDLLIEQMERREEMEGRLQTLEADLAGTRRQLDEALATSGKEVVESERALAERRAEHGAVASEIDPEVLALYEELRAQKKGIGAAGLVDGVCGGCHQKLSPVYLDRLKRAEGIARCEYCRRILVLA